MADRVLDLLLSKVDADPYPSSTMLDMIEDLLASPDDVDAYREVLARKVEADSFPSIPMLTRLTELG